MLKHECLAARGSRGEARVVIRTAEDASADEEGVVIFCLTTGQRLRATDVPRVFETLDDRRTFTLC